jgi:hypothetical protein
MKFAVKTTEQLLKHFEAIEYAKAARDWKLNWEPLDHTPFSGESHIAQYYPVVYQGKQLLYYSIYFVEEVGQWLIILARDVDIADAEDLKANSFQVWQDDPHFESVLIQMIQSAMSSAFAIEKVV